MARPRASTGTSRSGASAALADQLREICSGSLGRSALMGVAGSFLITVGGYGAGAKPRPGPTRTAMRLDWLVTGVGQSISTVLIWVGVLLMIWAWVRIGRDVLSGRASLARLRWVLAVWVLPMLLAIPMFSRDAYSYLAQGALLRDGFDPYAVGPDVSPGPVLDNVSPTWRSTTAPYGPVFLLLARGITTISGDHVVLGVLLMRLALLPGLVLMVWAIPRLAHHLGGDAARALWLAVLNPLVLIHLVAGIHNDLLMLGLMVAGVLLVLERRHLLGIVLIALAVGVKATAGVTLPFVVWIWMAHERGKAWGEDQPRPRSWPLFLKIAGSGAAVFVAVFGLASLVAGVGLGWISALSGSSKIINWLSLPTIVAQLVTEATSWFTGTPLSPVLAVTRVVGGIVLVGLAVVIWLRYRRTRTDAVMGIVFALVVIVVLSPAALPWYYSWPLALAAGFSLSRRTLVVIVGLSTWLMLVFQPAGDTALYVWPQVVVAVLAAVLAGWSLAREDPLRLWSRLRRHT